MYEDFFIYYFVVPINCPEDWLGHNGHCFKLDEGNYEPGYSSQYDENDPIYFCGKLNSYMAVIPDEATNEVVKKLGYVQIANFIKRTSIFLLTWNMDVSLLGRWGACLDGKSISGVGGGEVVSCSTSIIPQCVGDESCIVSASSFQNSTSRLN